ncbi:cryptochrome/photolyase family protein [Klenkia brasiliensis]|uniref:Deoxyribodipyrimidine photo-lyase n=1 Tax=Klenkia brasiliensis TaxID=333142 RepID=A0A1G7LV38_9ACTN|nr:deoxyribodipyrimidine photo-lyase [Klenkia brasiliensis]SDF53448.1 deoxyribodipyrimidine photo-lyase [Klenkia brasiliensis]
MPTAIHWFRRDLRLGDNPALLAAREAGDVLPLFVLDPAIWEKSGDPRKHFLAGCLAELHEATDGRLVVRHGKPQDVVPALAREVGAETVHVAGDTGPYGRQRDAAVEKALGDDAELVRTGSPYAVAPGTITKDDGTPFKVFTPFSRRWRDHGWHDPAARPRKVSWARADGEDLPEAPDLGDTEVLEPGEAAAHRRWKAFLDDRIEGYDDERNRPDLDTTSRMSAHLHFGTVHPRTLLKDIADSGKSGTGVETYTTELCWRDFYADVLWHRPETAREYYNPELQGMTYCTGKQADEDFDAWAAGRTGFPVVDAAMRQLLAEGWMHNRMRMITASFLVKDLHQEWTRGARYFMQHLVDGDLASNNHGWQWVAGTGTDAAPYFRVFNPVSQGQKFDPDGDYVRRYVPELRGIEGKKVHEPWEVADDLPEGYPERIVDHKHEREVALDRYAKARGR